MGQFSADLEQLERLGAIMHALADDADFPPIVGDAENLTTSAGLLGDGAVLESIVAINRTSRELLDGVLVPGVRHRITTIGDVMSAIADMYREQDGTSAAELADAYRAATGDWSAEAPA